MLFTPGSNLRVLIGSLFLCQQEKRFHINPCFFNEKQAQRKKESVICDLRMLNIMSNNPNSEFADYLWMGDEMDNFDQQMEAEFEEEIKEEEFIKSCIEQLLDEEEEQTVYFNPTCDPNVPNKLLFDPHMFYQNSNQQVPNGMNMVPLTQHMQSMYIQQPAQHQNGHAHGAHIPNITPMTNGHHPEKPVENILSKVSYKLKFDLLNCTCCSYKLHFKIL